MFTAISATECSVYDEPINGLDVQLWTYANFTALCKKSQFVGATVTTDVTTVKYTRSERECTITTFFAVLNF
jgi:hypothetical protein